MRWLPILCSKVGGGTCFNLHVCLGEQTSHLLPHKWKRDVPYFCTLINPLGEVDHYILHVVADDVLSLRPDVSQLIRLVRVTTASFPTLQCFMGPFPWARLADDPSATSYWPSDKIDAASCGRMILNNPIDCKNDVFVSFTALSSMTCFSFFFPRGRALTHSPWMNVQGIPRGCER